MAAIGLVAGVTGAMLVVLLRGSYPEAPLPNEPAHAPTQPPLGKVFTPEVQYWTPKILQWSQQYGVDPNILATVIQIESCGDYLAGSGAGALGLFQVIQSHFVDGEDPHDPDTNARRGVGYLKGSLERSDGHVGLAMAGYNGGWGVINLGWGTWVRETRLYYIWGSQIYLDAIHGKTTAESAALQNWLASGGVNLCHQAYLRLFTTPTPAPTQPPIIITLPPGQSAQ